MYEKGGEMISASHSKLVMFTLLYLGSSMIALQLPTILYRVQTAGSTCLLLALYFYCLKFYGWRFSLVQIKK